jgi:nickel transport protein
VLDGGVWAKTYDGTQKGSRADHPEALASWQSREVVCLMRNRLPQTPKGFALTPADDLAKARIGERMRFRATLNGAPLANIPVAYFGATRGVTDANGYINIRLKTPGLQQLTASHSAPSVNPGVDQTITSYTLNFEVAE